MHSSLTSSRYYSLILLLSYQTRVLFLSVSLSLQSFDMLVFCEIRCIRALGRTVMYSYVQYDVLIRVMWCMHMQYMRYTYAEEDPYPNSNLARLWTSSSDLCSVLVISLHTNSLCHVLFLKLADASFDWCSYRTAPFYPRMTRPCVEAPSCDCLAVRWRLLTVRNSRRSARLKACFICFISESAFLLQNSHAQSADFEQLNQMQQDLRPSSTQQGRDFNFLCPDLSSVAKSYLTCMLHDHLVIADSVLQTQIEKLKKVCSSLGVSPQEIELLLRDWWKTLFLGESDR